MGWEMPDRYEVNVVPKSGRSDAMAYARSQKNCSTMWLDICAIA